LGKKKKVENKAKKKFRFFPPVGEKLKLRKTKENSKVFICCFFFLIIERVSNIE